MSTSRLRTYFVRHWQPICGGAAMIATALFLLLWRLTTLVPGVSSSEVVTYDRAHLGFRALLDAPVNLPYVALVHFGLIARPTSASVARLLSVMFALAVLIAFYWLMQHWHGHRIAIMATFLFMTSTRFLHTARLGTPQILLFGLFFLVTYGVWLRERTRPRLALPVGLLLVCLLVYVPGMIWFVLAGIVWQWRPIIDKIWKTPVWLTILSILPALAILFPLGWSIAKHPKLAETFVGIPQPFPHVSQIVHNLINIPLQLFYTHSTVTSDMGTPGLLTLDAFAIVMFIFGVYLYIQHYRLVRTGFLIGILVISAALIGLGSMTVTILLPFIYMIIAAGVAYLLGQWLSVFPRNIFARSTGIILLSLVIVLCCTYNLRRYFVAWPSSAATQSLFSNRSS